MFKLFNKNKFLNICNTNSLFKIVKRNLYNDNLDLERNLDFTLNLGYNNLTSLIKPNINFMQLSKFLMKRKLLYTMRHYYKHLLESVEKGEVQILDEILEKNLKFTLFQDLSRLYGDNLNFKVVNKKEPIFIKFLNIYELQNVNVDREKNGIISEYDLRYEKGGKVISLQKYDPYEELKKEGKNLSQIRKERENFEKSDFRKLAYDKMKTEVKANFAIDFIKNRVGQDLNDKGAEYIANVIEQLEKKENFNDPYSSEIKAQFSDYYKLRDQNIEEKMNKTDLYDYFRVTMPHHYKNFLEVYQSRQGLIKTFLESIRKRFYKKYVQKSKKISKERTLYVIDVEITSKMRLEVLDEKGENALETIYNYKNRMMSNLGNFLQNNSDLLEYDTSIYNFSVPDRKWNLHNKDFMQTHIVRFEFEKKNKFRNIFKKPYDTLMITDIDMVLKGNKHFKFSKDFM